MLSLVDTCATFIAINKYLLDKDSLVGIPSHIGAKVAKLIVRQQPLAIQDVRLIRCFREAFGLVGLSALQLSGFSCLRSPSNSVTTTLEYPERASLFDIIRLDCVMHLNLNGCTAVCTDELLGVIGQLSRLRRLDISDIGMEDRHTILLRCCTDIRRKGLISLLSLDASGNQLTVYGARRLLDFPNLTELNIQYNLITRESMKTLCRNGWTESPRSLPEISTQGWLKDYLTPRPSRNARLKPRIVSSQSQLLIRSSHVHSMEHVISKRSVTDEKHETARVEKRRRLDDELLDLYK